MLARLNAHRAWANRLTVEWALAHAASDEYSLKMLSHVLRAEEAWLVRLRGALPENKIWVAVPPGELDALRAANDAGLTAAVEADVTQPGRMYRYTRFDGTPMESSVADILAHVFLHGIHHRAQIAANASRMGLPKLPVTDFIAFAREFP